MRWAFASLIKALADREKSVGNREVTKDTLATLKDGYAHRSGSRPA